jgi:TPR repeat protein
LKSYSCVADIYLTENPSKEDEIEAFKWYEKAAMMGDIYAQKRLVNCYELGIGN